MLNKYKDLILEVFRYLLVGGTAFLIDIGTIYLLNEFVFHDKYI